MSEAVPTLQAEAVKPVEAAKPVFEKKMSGTWVKVGPPGSTSPRADPMFRGHASPPHTAPTSSYDPRNRPHDITTSPRTHDATQHGVVSST